MLQFKIMLQLLKLYMGQLSQLEMDQFLQVNYHLQLKLNYNNNQNEKHQIHNIKIFRYILFTNITILLFKNENNH